MRPSQKRKCITAATARSNLEAVFMCDLQRGCGFLSGSRRDANDEEREDCYGRATVALTRAIQHTYIVSPVDMGGLVGVAQTLAVYHYGYLTLRQSTIQDHERASLPTDAAAVFEWGLDTSFTSRDKPPLSIAMVFTANGERVVRRYRLVIAQKTRLKLNPQVTAALTSHASAHHLTTSHFFPCSIDREYLFGYAAHGYRSPLWLCAAYEGSPVLVHRQRATKVTFHKAVQERRLLILPWHPLLWCPSASAGATCCLRSRRWPPNLIGEWSRRSSRHGSGQLLRWWYRHDWPWHRGRRSPMVSSDAWSCWWPHRNWNCKRSG